MVALMAAHCGFPVVFLAVTTTLGPVVRLREMRSDVVDHVMTASVTRPGVTDAAIVAPSPPVRMAPPLPVSAIRYTRLPSPAASYCCRTPAGSQLSIIPFGEARKRFHGLKARTSLSESSLEYVNAGVSTFES